jgi:hypothetical protein
MRIEGIDTLKGLIDRANKVMEVSKKLSTKTRKKMKDSTFCGPNRSFPINDCAHYTAGLRLLNRSKFSAEEKAKIKKCILNKGVKLGCKNAKENKKENSSYLTLEIKELYDSEEFATTKQLVEASIKDPNKSLNFYLGLIV